MMKKQLNINTNSLLSKYAGTAPKTDEQMADEQNEEGVPEDRINSITISNFKSNKLSHIDKKHRAEEVEKLRQMGID